MYYLLNILITYFRVHLSISLCTNKLHTHYHHIQNIYVQSKYKLSTFIVSRSLKKTQIIESNFKLIKFKKASIIEEYPTTIKICNHWKMGQLNRRLEQSWFILVCVLVDMLRQSTTKLFTISHGYPLYVNKLNTKRIKINTK